METFKTRNYLFSAIALLLFCGKVSHGQDKYEMKSVYLKTRWANLVSPKNALKAYPRPQMERKNWRNLNGLWSYTITEKDTPQPTSFDGQILVPYPLESALSGVQKSLKPEQNLWYKRNIPNVVKSKSDRILLHFGAVDWQATVFVNGREIGQHQGGYTAFSFDITDELKTGDNELIVKVLDPTDKGIGPHGKQVLNPESIYYTPSSGIWQTVWLETVPNTHIESLVMTPDVDKGTLKLTVKGGEGTTFTTIVSSGKSVVKQVQSDGKHNGIEIKIPNARLWSPEDPFLYDMVVQLKKNGKVVDEVKSYFGMRKVSVQKDEQGVDRIFLNNKPYFNLGVLDQGFWPDGLYTAPTDEALAFDIKAVKAMGFNTIRKHIKVEPARWYYHADKIGMLVWQDMVNPNQGLPKGSKEAFEKESSEIVAQLYNSPCITTYVLFNEKWGQYDQERLTKWLKQADPSRIVNGHSGEYLYVNNMLRSPSDNPYVGSDMTDVHSYPDPMMSLKLPGKAQVLGEFGGIGVQVNGHEWNDQQGWGYIQVTATELKQKYGAMVNQLKKLQGEGLSASIYTQPFDVEGEENGLLTYDREIIKIPVEEIRKINSSIIPQKGFQRDNKFVIAKDIDPNDNDSRFKELLAEYNKGKSDSSFLRRLTLMSARKADTANLIKVGNSYIDILKTPFTKENLLFISSITKSTKSRGFDLFIKNKETVNNVLGEFKAEYKIKEIISLDELDQLVAYGKDINWDSLENILQKKYGDLGQEQVLQTAMIYGYTTNNWELFGHYYVLYFSKALDHPVYSINNLSWAVFEHITDFDILSSALKFQKYALERWYKESPIEMDTYANLLYKVGKKEEAIKWEEKAVSLDPNNKDNATNLEKMKKGIPTWLTENAATLKLKNKIE